MGISELKFSRKEHLEIFGMEGGKAENLPIKKLKVLAVGPLVKCSKFACKMQLLTFFVETAVTLTKYLYL